MSNELDKRRAHIANGGTIENYDRSHYSKEKQMIQVTLTSTSGTTKRMEFDSKDRLLEFIKLYKAALHQGQAVCIDAPLVGIHSGWIQGEKLATV
jgi:hypothetical protein